MLEHVIAWHAWRAQCNRVVFDFMRKQNREHGPFAKAIRDDVIWHDLQVWTLRRWPHLADYA